MSRLALLAAVAAVGCSADTKSPPTTAAGKMTDKMKDGKVTDGKMDDGKMGDGKMGTPATGKM